MKTTTIKVRGYCAWCHSQPVDTAERCYRCGHVDGTHIDEWAYHYLGSDYPEDVYIARLRCAIWTRSVDSLLFRWGAVTSDGGRMQWRHRTLLRTEEYAQQDLAPHERDPGLVGIYTGPPVK